MAQMTTAHPAILALVSLLGVMPEVDAEGLFWFKAEDRFIHASTSKKWLYLGAGHGGPVDGSYVTGRVPLDFQVTGLTMTDPFGTLRTLYRNNPGIWEDKDFHVWDD